MAVLEQYREKAQEIMSAQLAGTASPLRRLRTFFEEGRAKALADGFSGAAWPAAWPRSWPASTPASGRCSTGFSAACRVASPACCRKPWTEGELRPDEDPAELASFLMASWQGAVTRAKAAGHDGPAAHLRSHGFRTPPAFPRPRFIQPGSDCVIEQRESSLALRITQHEPTKTSSGEAMRPYIPFRAPVPYVKTTGHISLSPWSFSCIFIVLVSLLSPAPAAAADFHLILANDPIFGNKEGDNLYTAGLGIEVQRGYRVFQGGERMFTDREVGQRFDETYLALEQRLKSWGAWEPSLGFGVLHIGHGLLGQSVQNSHPPGDRQRDLRPRLPRAEQMVRRADGEGRTQRPLRRRAAADHRDRAAHRPRLPQLAAGHGQLRGPFGKHFSWRAGAGVHAEDASYALLERNVKNVAPAGELGIAWRALTLTWTYNALGTASSHLILGMNVPLKVLDGAIVSAARRR